jgi:type II secretory pathway component PulF
MMIFRITGADSKTGEDRTILVRSDDERKAIAAAKSKGVHPYQVQRDSTAEKAESERQQAAHAAAEVQRRTASVIEAMRQRIKRGKSVFLYESVYVPVDSSNPSHERSGSA